MRIDDMDSGSCTLSSGRRTLTASIGGPGASPVGLLSRETFSTVVANAPLVAIDLILEDAQGRILLGLRNNPPAKGYWFVPGGRIRKDETLDAAFSRIAYDELGLHARRGDQQFIGVYEHFYDVNFNGMENATTHYVVLAHKLKLSATTLELPLQQHSGYQWIQPECIVRHPDVHPYTKAYFK